MCNCIECVGYQPEPTLEEELAAMRSERDGWKRMAELQYGALRCSMYAGQENYPVEGALDVLFNRMMKGEWP